MFLLIEAKGNASERSRARWNREKSQRAGSRPRNWSARWCRSHTAAIFAAAAAEALMQPNPTINKTSRICNLFVLPPYALAFHFTAREPPE